jgi:hypothetical protein
VILIKKVPLERDVDKEIKEVIVTAI